MGQGKTESLPTLYAGWVECMLGAGIPAETDATCHDCAMCAKEGDDPSEQRFYNPETQCCTFFPAMPNYLVGGVLLDRALRYSPLRSMVKGEGSVPAIVSPLGVFPSDHYRALYTNNTGAFGQDADMRCPYHVSATKDHGPMCGVWRHRQSTCATWFCKYVRGATGHAFWSRLHVLLGRAEESLRWWCAMELDVGDAAMDFMTHARVGAPASDGQTRNKRLDRDLGPREFALMWGKWAKRKTRFYQEAARLVQALSWDDVLAICGPDVAVQTRLVQAAYARLIDKGLPQRLTVGDFRVVALDAVKATLICGVPPSPMEIPRVLLDLMPYFDGRPVPRVLEAIQQDHGITVQEGLVRKLMDNGILSAPKPE